MIAHENNRALRVRKLYDAILELRTPEEARCFLLDLCTPSELSDLADRWRTVQLLDEGLPYRRISELTGVSTATITRVARALVHGEGGYRQVLERTKMNAKRGRKSP